MEELFDSPLALVIITAVVVFVVGRSVWRWRRGSALRDHARDHGWEPVEDGEPFADLVTRPFPELREQAEQDARAARRSGAGRRRGPGVNVSLNAPGSTRSRTRARNVHLVPVEGGEFACGDVTITGTTGKLAQGRATIRCGAVAAHTADDLPDLRLLSRSWIDRDTGGTLPGQLRERFNDVELDAEARAAYIDSGAWQALLDAPEETDGIAVDDGRVVVLSRRELTPERIEALTDVARRFVVDAVNARDEGDPSAGPRLADPLTTH